MSSSVTIKELEEWELNGAIWRPVEVTDQRAVIERWSRCSGEPMDRVESEEPKLIEYVRARRAD